MFFYKYNNVVVVFSIVLLLLFPCSLLADDLENWRGIEEKNTPIPEKYSVDLKNESCLKSLMKGEQDAKEKHVSGGWGIGGFAGGLALGLIGTALMTLGASASSPTIPTELLTQPEIDIGCYSQGYTKMAQRKNRNEALAGGICGTIGIVLLIIAASSGK